MLFLRICVSVYDMLSLGITFGIMFNLHFSCYIIIMVCEHHCKVINGVVNLSNTLAIFFLAGGKATQQPC